MGPPCKVLSWFVLCVVFCLWGIRRAVVHKLVELCLVFGVTQARQEGFKVGLLFLQATECFCFIGVKGRIARGEPHVTGGVAAALAARFAKHTFAPDHISEKGEANWPEED